MQKLFSLRSFISGASIFGALLMGQQSHAAIGYGFEVLYAAGSPFPSSGDTGNYLTDRSGEVYAINDINLATSTTTSATITPQYVRNTDPTNLGSYQWDTEQLTLGSPFNEKVVVEGRIGNGAADHQSNFIRVSYSGTPPAPFQGNLQPSASFVTPTTGFTTITAGNTMNFTVAYNATTKIITYSGLSANPLTFTVSEGFKDIVIRVNTNGRTTTGADNVRNLSLANLQLAVGGAPAVDLERTLGSITSNTLTANSVTTSGDVYAIGQRQFGIWEDIVDDAQDFTLTGQVTYTWSGPNAPGGSQMAFQIKLGDGLSPIPEPSHFAAFLGLSLLTFIFARRRR